MGQLPPLSAPSALPNFTPGAGLPPLSGLPAGLIPSSSMPAAPVGVVPAAKSVGGEGSVISATAAAAAAANLTLGTQQQLTNGGSGSAVVDPAPSSS